MLRERERARLELERLDGTPPVVLYDPAADELYRGLWEDEADDASPARGRRIRGRRPSL